MRKPNTYKIAGCLMSLLCLASLTGCDEHQWPDNPDKVAIHLRLRYDTDMTEWNHTYSSETVTETGYGDTYDNSRESGLIRYVIRAYPSSQTSEYTEEFVYTKDIAEGYDYDVTLSLVPDDYNIMVWSDLAEQSSDGWFYDKENFSEISITGEHQGNTDYRDAFRGSSTVTLVADVLESDPDTLDIAMQRPLAKYEFVSTDLTEFVSEELLRLEQKAREESGSASGSDQIVPASIDIGDYKAVFYYVGYMPDTFSMTTDKPVDSTMGVIFETELSELSDSEASVGFDYVFVNGTESSVTVQIGIYDGEGTQLSLSGSIKVPLKRSHHTIMRGRFLTMEASGGVSVDPSYDGEYNIIYE